MFLNKIMSVLFLIISVSFMSVSNVVLAQSGGSLSKSQQAEEAKSSQDQTYMIDINAAGVDELMSLKGIGKKRAEALLADREHNGKFNTISDLSRVKGFSEKLVSRIMEQNQGKIIAGK